MVLEIERRSADRKTRVQVPVLEHNVLHQAAVTHYFELIFCLSLH